MSCLVEVEHLAYAYPPGHPALRDVTFHLRHGERVGLIGPNGAGKTTLLLILAGLLEAAAGAVAVAGCDLCTAAGRRQVHRKLGVVFQNTDDQILNATVEDDVAFGPLNLGLPREAVEARVRSALARVGLGEAYRARIPFHLSAGEKRRVAIAGALALEPQILLLDEPTSDLDPRGRRELREILEGLSVTRLISSHNLEFVLETCERVLLLDEGRLCADGPAIEVLADADLMLRHGLEVPPSLAGAGRPARAASPAATAPPHRHGTDFNATPAHA
jgi:cobalt/nickel transport system ATP-binding protein